MGVLDVPRRLLYTYLRVVGLGLLIAYSLAQRAWLSVRPALTPVVNVYDTIDTDTLSVNTLLQQFVKVVLMVGALYWRLVQAVWETVSRPFSKQLQAGWSFLDELKAEYQQGKET